ncbi:insulinase family protein [Fulvivirgaceae bacterium BMA10]|uniref:Insulinase family protein n=1 Tax=Splendidivirga corallicola TaxID=3051826 RepID=A0ABT8KKW8_9BACT|nr:insulinase family protein [Fulvivirgaceae bacterium BMA10]
MKNMLKISVVAILFITAACNNQQSETGKFETKKAESNGYTYEYVTNDPLKVRIYTLENGLKVYLSDYKNEPRIQTLIAVKAGGKNDPAEATGLAHYLEHMMFKGTQDFGTLDWAKEKPLLDSIETMFEHYRTLEDADERRDYYKLIDQVSNEASKYAIPNEYDKLVSAIGAKRTNAYTTEDRTVYINDIPANQLENFLNIEGKRFKHIVNRLFHTELEAVYEEKNRSLDNDYWKTYETLYSSIFQKHPYGTQTVIGTIDHLKNPSITEIINYFEKYYVPNNVAICMSGDIDYDKTIKLIDQTFGDWKPNNELPNWNKVMEDPITAPIEKDVLGPDAERISFGFRFDGRGSDDYKMVTLIDMLLNNSEAGLIDLNLVQKQKVLEAGCSVDDLNDYIIHTFNGTPRDGQSLKEVKNLILEQIELIKKGEFEDWLIDAVITDLKKSKVRQTEFNWARASDLVTAFTNDIPWKNYISEIDDLKKITKQEIIDFANEHYKDNYVAVYKRTGKDTTVQKVEKPEITKVALNTEQKSPFFKELLENDVEPLKPVFVDYDKDIKKAKMNKDIEVLYTSNTENDLFSLYYLSDVGSNNDPKMKIAVEYLEYLGTDKLTSEEFKKELYKLGCSFSVFAAEDRTYVVLSGLSENMEKSMQLFEELLESPQPDEEALKNLVDGILKEREDAKKDKFAILYNGMMSYGQYGSESPFTNVLSNKALLELTPDELINIIKGFTKTEHRILYYGPKDENELVTILNENHKLPEQLQPAPELVEYIKTNVDNTQVYWTDYDMVQAEIMFINKGEPFNNNLAPVSRLYNEYFGATVFQEIREAQGLAYSVWANYGLAGKADGHDSYMAYVGTQADKQSESMEALLDIINNIPESKTGLETAKKAIMNKIESERITKTSILFNYENAKRKQLDYDVRKDIYEQVQNMTLEDVKAFQEKYIKDQNYNIMVLGNRDKLDFSALRKYGSVKELSLEELFGYEKVEKIHIQ